MTKNILNVVTSSIVALTVIAASPLKSQAITFDFTFDGTPDGTVTPPIVGTGTFSFDGDPTDGTFALTSLTNYDFNFDFNGNSFTNTNIATPLANILVQVSTIGSDRFVNFGGSGGGPFVGSLDFINGGSNLSFQPNFGSLYFVNNGAGFGTYQGIEPTNSTPVPTPSSILGILTFSLGTFVLKKKKLGQPNFSKN